MSSMMRLTPSATSAYTQPVVNPISVTSTNREGATTKFFASSSAARRTTRMPIAPIRLGRGKRVARVGAEASAATGSATLLRGAAKSYPKRRGYDPGATPKWRNWQTRRTQNPVPFGECGFDSHLRHLCCPLRSRPGASRRDRNVQTSVPGCGVVGVRDGPSQKLLPRLARVDVTGELAPRKRVEEACGARMPRGRRGGLLERGERVGDDCAVGGGVARDRLVQELGEPRAGCVRVIERVVVDDDQLPVEVGGLQGAIDPVHV